MTVAAASEDFVVTVTVRSSRMPDVAATADNDGSAADHVVMVSVAEVAVADAADNVVMVSVAGVRDERTSEENRKCQFVKSFQ